MEENKNMLMKTAVSYGFLLGVFWCIKYIFFMWGAKFPFFNAIYWGLTILVPFIAYFQTSLYKKTIGGKIGFFHAWQFGILLYFFAALLVCLEHYIFYQYIAPPEFLSNAVGQVTEIFKDRLNEEALQSLNQLTISPIQMALQGILNNVFYGVIFSIPVAALLCRNNETGTIIQQPQNKNNEA